MSWETIAAIVSIIAAAATGIGLFVKCGKLLHIIESLESDVEENKQKSIESDKAQYEKIHDNKVQIEEKLKSTEDSLTCLIKEKVQELVTQITSNTKATSDVKFDLEAFKWDVTTHLMDVLKENMTELVMREIDRLNEKSEASISVVEESIDLTKEALEDKIAKLEKRINNIEYKDIRPLRDAITELKQQIKDK